MGAGVVDRDYRGNVGVVLFNLSKADYQVQHGDRIAQLIIERISTPPLVEVEVRIKLQFCEQTLLKVDSSFLFFSFGTALFKKRAFLVAQGHNLVA